MTDRRAEITAVGIHKGTVVCEAEDLDRPDREYGPIPFARPTREKLVVPRIGTKVAISQFYDGSRYVSGILSTPGSNGGSPLENGTIAFVLNKEGSEKILFERTDSGYEVTVDVDSDVTVDTDGKAHIEAQEKVHVTGSEGVMIDEGGTPKKVATEDHTHPYDWTDKAGSGDTGKPDDVTKTEVE